MIKPRLRKLVGLEYWFRDRPWLCAGDGLCGFGSSPSEAYAAWVSAVTVFRKVSPT